MKTYLIILATALLSQVPEAGASSAALSWDPSPGATGYKVYYGIAPREYTNSTDVGNTLSTLVTGLEPSKGYYFAAKSYNTQWQSGYSNEQHATTPPAPMPVGPVTVSAPVAGTVYKVVATPAPDPAVTKWAWKFPGAVNPLQSKGRPLPVTVYFLAPGAYRGVLVKYVGTAVKETVTFDVPIP